MKLPFKVLLLAFAFANGLASAQQNFSFQPAQPKPGDEITVVYKPAGNLAGTLKKVEAVFYLYNGMKFIGDDLLLTKNGRSYTAKFKTDTSTNFVQLGFYVDKTFDNNFNEGYTIQFYLGDKVKKGSYLSQSLFYQYYAQQTGAEKNNDKALDAIEKEFSLYPESRNQNLRQYYTLFGLVKKDQLATQLQKEIESQLKTGLKTEKDYANIESLYGMAKLPEQAKLIKSIKKEKFPEGDWRIEETMNQLFTEADATKKFELAKSIVQNIETNKDWKKSEGMTSYCKNIIMGYYLKNKQWDVVMDEFRKSKNKMDVASAFNNTAWNMQEKKDNLEKAEELAALATETAKQEMKNPTSPKPDYLTTKKWKEQREGSYSMYSDTYAMVLYQRGLYDKGFALAEENAITIGKRENTDFNTTYAYLAEKALPKEKAKKEFESFVKNGKASSVVKEKLKNIYIEEKKSDAGFEDYVAALEKEAYLKMVDEIRKGMIDEKSPTFALKNLNNELVSLESLKGKVVVVDFWATWCGPCKASFPGMQRVVDKYKSNPDVQFLFVDTWENGDEKNKKAEEFIAENKYTFNVLMDNENEVIEKYKVSGIPTKFVLDKTGQIRFKAVGFNGNDEKLVKEMDVMIELCSNPQKVF